MTQATATAQIYHQQKSIRYDVPQHLAFFAANYSVNYTIAYARIEKFITRRSPLRYFFSLVGPSEIMRLMAVLIIQTHSYGYGEYLLQPDLD